MERGNDIFNVRTVRSIDVKLPVGEWGEIFLAGNESELSDKMADICGEVLNGLDLDATFYKYRLRVISEVSEDCNVICPIEHPVNHIIYYIVAQSDIDDLDLAVAEVINESEAQMRKFYEEALVEAAIDSPDMFRKAVDRVVWGKDSPYLTDSLSYGIIAEPNLGTAIYRAVIRYGQKAAQGFFGDKPVRVSARARNEAFENLPNKLSEAFEKQNPEDFEIVKETFRNMTASEMQAIIFELAKKKSGLLHAMQSTALNAASRYEIYVRPWKSVSREHFKDRYSYCIYLKNGKGIEIPVTFKNYPSYCIYMMYIIDRVQRGDDVTELVIKKNKQAFCELYKTIISETEANIKKLYEEMDHRTIAATGKIRKGRYDDYIKDIYDTLEKLVGDIDSIPLKVGHGRYLGVLPERIFIDERLTKFKFS